MRRIQTLKNKFIMMNVKLDTKEKFKVLTLQTEHITASMTEELEKILKDHSKADIPHMIINMNEVKRIDSEVAETFSSVQQSFYENSLSFVLCEMHQVIIQVFEKEDLLDALNYTPSLSEAWDIVQMEEIERELMEGFD